MLQGDYFYIHRCHSEAQPKNLNLNIQECEMLRLAQHDMHGVFYSGRRTYGE
jgi:hypothetical protein